ncbi:MAG: hypothetical protein AB201_01225 [Parcubacteria bacterium C7867-006]|nr:MAG: hypothetical protein AB201_01225 [Parcubacteria bacterium C7867-006]
MEDQKDEDSESQPDWSCYGDDGVDVLSLHRCRDHTTPQYRDVGVVPVSGRGYRFRGLEGLQRLGQEELEGVFLILLHRATRDFVAGSPSAFIVIFVSGGNSF